MKKELRTRYLSIRDQLNMEEVNHKSNLIIENIKKQFDLEKYSCIAFYMPLGKEVNLKPLMEELLSKNNNGISSNKRLK